MAKWGRQLLHRIQVRWFSSGDIIRINSNKNVPYLNLKEFYRTNVILRSNKCYHIESGACSGFDMYKGFWNGSAIHDANYTKWDSGS